jgi:hypothetical protein
MQRAGKGIAREWATVPIGPPQHPPGSHARERVDPGQRLGVGGVSTDRKRSLGHGDSSVDGGIDHAHDHACALTELMATASGDSLATPTVPTDEGVGVAHSGSAAQRGCPSTWRPTGSSLGAGRRCRAARLPTCVRPRREGALRRPWPTTLDPCTPLQQNMGSAPLADGGTTPLVGRNATRDPHRVWHGPSSSATGSKRSATPLGALGLSHSRSRRTPPRGLVLAPSQLPAHG